MKKLLLSSLAAAGLVAMVPAAFAMNIRGHMLMTPGNYHADENRAMAKPMSRRQLQSGTWSYRAQTRTGFTRPKSFVTDKKASSSSSMSSSASSK